MFFDEVMPFLDTEGELKVLLYIFRHTYGWQKECDCISISQFVGGIVTKRGKRLDYGTGLAKSTVVSALTSVVEQEYVFRYIAGRGSQRRSYYFLHTAPNQEIVRDLENGKLSIEQVLGSKFKPKFGLKVKPNSPDALGSTFGHTKERSFTKKQIQNKRPNPPDPRPAIIDERLCEQKITRDRRREGYSGQPQPIGNALRAVYGKLQSLRQTAHEISDQHHPGDGTPAPQTEPGPDPGATVHPHGRGH